jgi:hypothetical protein
VAYQRVGMSGYTLSRKTHLKTKQVDLYKTII